MLGLFIALIGVGLAAGMAFIGSAKGVGIVGRVSAGVLSEKPHLFGIMLVLQALPGTQGFYGLVAAFLTLVRLGILGGTAPDMSIAQGLQVFAALVPIMLGQYFSAIWQGEASAASALMVAKEESMAGRSLIIPALVETYAVLALLTSIILLLFAVQI